jgi:hypothetical protein
VAASVTASSIRIGLRILSVSLGLLIELGFIFLFLRYGGILTPSLPVLGAVMVGVAVAAIAIFWRFASSLRRLIVYQGESLPEAVRSAMELSVIALSISAAWATAIPLALCIFLLIAAQHHSSVFVHPTSTVILGRSAR